MYSVKNIFIFCIFIFSCYHCFQYGKYISTTEYKSKLLEINNKYIELKNNNILLEREYNIKTAKLQNELSNIKLFYENSINTNTNDFNSELLKSKQRADFYKRQASDCTVKSRNLAEHTAQLDEQLTKGVYLVKELTELIRFRDKQLILVGKQLQLDRELINE